MVSGILLIVIGAIFAFAVRGDTEAVDLQKMGVILMLGGLAFVYQARKAGGRLRETRVIDDLSDPKRQVHIVREYASDDEPADGSPARWPAPADDHAGESPPAQRAAPAEDRPTGSPPVHLATPTDDRRQER